MSRIDNVAARRPRRIANALIVATAIAGATSPMAHADAQDQQFLEIVHANNIPGQDAALIAYGRAFCASDGPYWDTVLPLYGQGVNPGQLYPIRVAASRAYCPNRIAVPVAPPQVYTGL
jgi:hypothetical protein